MARPRQLLFVMDPLARLDLAGDTTLAWIVEARARGHEAWWCGPEHLGCEADDAVARAWRVEAADLADGARAEGGAGRAQPLGCWDAVFMRKDPPIGLEYLTATMLLERARGKTLLVNDPRGLREINEKLAILQFPELTPRTIVTRDMARLRSFLAEQEGVIVVKPLDGAGGSGVFVACDGDPNLSSIFEQVTGFGARWAMAQRYLPEVRAGDKRIILLDGAPVGAVLRVPADHEARANLHVGGKPQATELDAAELNICAVIGPWLRSLGQVFVGIDVIGGKLTEINVTSPTGIRQIAALGGPRLEVAFLDWVERAISALGR